MNVCKLTIPPPAERPSRNGSTSAGTSGDPCSTEAATETPNETGAGSREAEAPDARPATIGRTAVRRYLAG